MLSASVRPLALSPQPVALSAVIVCETTPYWAPELQRQFHQTDIAVRGCRKWSDLSERSTEFARVVHVVNFDDAPADCLTGLRNRGTCEAIPLILMASGPWGSLEFVLREAGASAFFAELPTGPELAQCCRRWLGK